MEPTFLDAFKSNPLPMLLAIVTGGAGLVLVVVGLIFANSKPKLGMVAGVLAALAGGVAFASGALGCWSGNARVEAAASTPGLSAKDRERLTAYGDTEALYSFECGGLGVLPLLGGLVALRIGFSRRDQS